METVHGNEAAGSESAESAGGAVAQATNKKRQLEASKAFIITRGKGKTPSTMFKLTKRSDQYNVLNYGYGRNFALPKMKLQGLAATTTLLGKS